MSGFAIFVQEGFGLDSASVYFTNEAPRYEAESVPVFAISGEDRVQVGEREETFVIFTPLNGAYRMRGKENKVPLHRLLSVVEQTNGEKGDDNV